MTSAAQKAIAKKYAQAFMQSLSGDYAKKSQKLSEAVKLLRPHMKILSHPCINPLVKTDILLRILDDKFKEFGIENFFRLLIVSKRIALAEQIDFEAQSLAKTLANIKEAQVYSRFEQSSEELAELQKTMEKIFDKKVSLRAMVKEDLIGGVQIMSGDLLIDGSLKGRLDKIRKAAQHT